MSRFFDGVDDFITVSGVSGIDTDLMSASFFVNFNTITSGGDPFCTASSKTAGNSAMDIYIDGSDSNNLTFAYRFSTTVGLWRLFIPSLGTWYHIGLTYDRSSTSNNPSFYLNGVSQSVTARVAPSGTKKTGVATFISGENAGGAADLNGYVAHIEFFAGKILSINEFKQLMRFPGSLAYSERKLYWPFWGSNSPEPDLSGNGNNGTVTGATAGSKNPPINGLYYPRVFGNEYAMTTPAGGGGWPYTNTGCHVLLDRWRRVA